MGDFYLLCKYKILYFCKCINTFGVVQKLKISMQKTSCFFRYFLLSIGIASVLLGACGQDLDRRVSEQHTKDTLVADTIFTPDAHTKTEYQYQIHFMDVGQGDAVLVITPGKKVLIDGGDLNSNVAYYLSQQNLQEIDIVIATHPHADHIGGLPEVFGSFPVGEVIDPGVVHSTLTYERYLTYIYELDIPYTTGEKGMVRQLSDNSTLEILYPAEINDLSLNNSSVVAKLSLGNIEALLTGDIEQEGENELLLYAETLSSDILKVAHHGSSTSSQLPFLEAVMPEVSVIMCGMYNSFGFPHEETLENLEQVDSEIFRTDIHGHIVILSDGETYEVVHTSERQIDLIDINLATIDKLTNIVHIGPERAKQIIDMRPFTSVDDLVRVDGIGTKRLEEIKKQNIVTVN